MPNAPLFAPTDSDGQRLGPPQWAINDTLNYMLDIGFPAEKLAVGR
jgi:hypothetical protein